MVEKQGKVIICNILIILTAIAAIVTLVIGSFWKVKVELKINNENAKMIAGQEKSESIEKLGEFEFVVPLEIEFKSMTLIKSVAGDSKKIAGEIVAETAANFLDVMLKNLGSVLKSVMKTTVNVVVEKAKEEIKKELGETASDTEVYNKLQSEYGVSKDDINDTLTEVSNAALAIMDGDTDSLRAILTDSETVDKLFDAYAKNELAKGASQDELDAKKAELKDKIVSTYDETVEKFEDENGEINQTSILSGVLKMTGIETTNEETGETKKIESEDDLKELVGEKVNGFLGENTQYVGWAIKGLGIFLIVVIASWGYIIIKCIVKMFMKNKTVGMFFPRFFGWMPHVFFVGIPMLVVRYGMQIASKFMPSATEGVGETITKLQNFLTLNIGSLTWVSALCTVILFVIWIPYYQWRRKIKKELKYGKPIQ